MVIKVIDVIKPISRAAWDDELLRYRLSEDSKKTLHDEFKLDLSEQGKQAFYLHLDRLMEDFSLNSYDYFDNDEERQKQEARQDKQVEGKKKRFKPTPPSPFFFSEISSNSKKYPKKKSTLVQLEINKLHELIESNQIVLYHLDGLSEWTKGFLDKKMLEENPYNLDACIFECAKNLGYLLKFLAPIVRLYASNAAPTGHDLGLYISFIEDICWIYELFTGKVPKRKHENGVAIGEFTDFVRRTADLASLGYNQSFNRMIRDHLYRLNHKDDKSKEERQAEIACQRLIIRGHKVSTVI